MRVQESWIYSAREDLILTLIILLVGVVFSFLPAAATQYQLGIFSFLLLPILIEQNHLLSTFVRVYADEEEFATRPILYRAVPLIALAWTCYLYIAHPLATFYLVYAIFSWYHYARQQYGWMMITTRKGAPDLSGQSVFLNKVFFYNLILGPFFYFLSAPSFAHLYLDYIPYRLPEWMAPIIGWGFLLTLFTNILYEIRYCLKTRLVNLSKYNQYFVALVTWGVINLCWGNREAGFFLIVSHSLSYCYVNYFIVSKRWPSKKIPGYRVFSTPYALGVVYLAFTMFSFFYWNFGYNSNVSQALTGHPTVLLILPFTVGYTHYILDAFLWGSKSNKIAREYIFSKPA